MRKMGGKYVIAVHEYSDTQYGKAEYPMSFFVGKRKYTLGTNTDKIKKFDSYSAAEVYIKSRRPAYTKNRKFEILYLTGKWWNKDEELNWFFSLENNNSETIDTELINKEIEESKSIIKLFEDIILDLSARAIKKREEFQNKILKLQQKIEFLKQQRSELLKMYNVNYDQPDRKNVCDD